MWFAADRACMDSDGREQVRGAEARGARGQGRGEGGRGGEERLQAREYVGVAFSRFMLGFRIGRGRRDVGRVRVRFRGRR